MKFKFLSFSLICAIASTFVSCQNTDEPIPVEIDSNEEMVEYSLSVNIPDEMRTRAQGSLSLGETGLYELSAREINKLWYAVYYDGQLKTSSSILREDDQPFSVSYRMTGSSDPTKLYFFLWAGNSEDPIETNNSSFNNPSSLLIFNFSSGNVKINPGNLNTGLYDSFAGYYQFSESSIDNVRSKIITLKRPFAEIAILSDDFTDTDLGEDYPKGFTSLAGFGSDIPSNSNNNLTNITIPYIWNYITETYSSLSYYSNSDSRLAYFKFYNDLKGSKFQTVTFKERQMDYLSFFYTFPSSENILNIAVNNGTKQSFQNSDKPSIISITLPQERIKANHKYIIYNKKRSDGGTGFLEGVYNYQILVNNDGSWDEPSTEQESDRI